jgi:D-alanyl-D-alanine carboxypeptidase
MVRMNEIAGELNMRNTNFVTLDGFHDDAHVISYNDLIILAKCAMDNEIIRTICGKKEATLHYVGASGKEYDVVYTNSNNLLQDSSPYYIPECIGLKTGYTNKAGICFLGVFRQGETDVIIGVFGAPDSDQRWQDMHTLWNYYLEQQNA